MAILFQMKANIKDIINKGDCYSRVWIDQNSGSLGCIYLASIDNLNALSIIAITNIEVVSYCRSTL